MIEQRLRSKGKVAKRDLVDADLPPDAATNVVDFMGLLQKSLASNKRTPAKKALTKPARKAATKAATKSAAKPAAKAAAKATPARKPGRATRA